MGFGPTTSTLAKFLDSPYSLKICHTEDSLGIRPCYFIHREDIITSNSYFSQICQNQCFQTSKMMNKNIDISNYTLVILCKYTLN